MWPPGGIEEVVGSILVESFQDEGSPAVLGMKVNAPGELQPRSAATISRNSLRGGKKSASYFGVSWLCVTDEMLFMMPAVKPISIQFHSTEMWRKKINVSVTVVGVRCCSVGRAQCGLMTERLAVRILAPTAHTLAAPPIGACVHGRMEGHWKPT